MLFLGLIFAIIAIAFMSCIFRKNLSIAFENLVNEILYNLFGMKEAIKDLIFAKCNKNDCLSQPGRIAIVTGGSRGIGVEIVKMLLELDMEVIIACRTPAAGEKTILQIRDSGVNSGKAKVYKLDNASLNSVKQFAAEIKKDYKQIHVLINNAGIMLCPYEETVDGFEHHWAVNYLSHFLLTALLLPLLKAGGNTQQCSRIVNVTSCAHLLGKINFSDINFRNRYIAYKAYAQSKLAQAIFNKRLAALLKEKEYCVQTYSAHPGIVYTEIFENNLLWKVKLVIRLFMKSPRQGATSIVYAAVNKEVENYGGIYIGNCRSSPPHSDVSNLHIQKQLFELSLQQVQLGDFFQYVS
ncbi:retinol dehydrogenase 12-like isoform X1 [Megachile rotundata]|uniref:retinol dehydrogenase 12-like isoform X1 n=2 Tax=Megachile rotundata TaxID=143995 RepID=UPI003FD053D3